MNAIDYINITINIIGAAVCLLILFFVAASDYGKKKRSRIFIRIITVHVAVLLMIAAENMLDINIIPENTMLIIALLMLIPLCGPVMLMFFVSLILTIVREKTTISKAAVCAAYIAVSACVIDIISTIITRSVLMYNMTAVSYGLIRNNWFLLSQFLSLVTMAISAGLLIVHRRLISKRELLTLLSYVVLPMVAIMTELYFWRLALINLSITFAVLIYYASVQSELSQQIKQKELELTESKVSIMLSQIQPHFLYNALTAIAQLCNENPAKAKKATLDFSSYLRSNMESLSHKGLISVEKELDHVKGYLDLERAIFGDDPNGNKLNVVYQIEAGGFLLPPLSIQPIAENAVKHGIGQKEGGGTVTVSVCQTDSAFLVSVSDDGVGYDTKNPYKDNRKHIGIENVRRRVEEQCGGTLEIVSETGKGTTAVIRVPKK
jgi:sensor histidine kinase YesM